MTSILGGVSHVEWVVATVLILYIFSSARTPLDLAALVDTSAGTLVVIVVAIAVFLNTNAVVGVLALVAGYELLRRSGRGHGTTGSYMGGAGQPSEEKRAQDFDKYNHFPRTLEEDMVHKMAPLVKSGGAPAVYQPTLHPQHSAASVHAKGIL